MASNYPGSLDSFDTIAADKKQSDTVGGRTHRAMHNDLGDAIESVQTELGTNPSGSDATVAARLTAIEAGTNLGTNSVGTAAIQDGAVTPAKMQRQVGNLLTDNQASGGDALGNTTGFGTWNAEPSYSGGRIVGTKNVGPGTGWGVAINPKAAVTPGQVYTIYAESERLTGAGIYTTLWWSDASNSGLGGVSIIPYTTASGVVTGKVTVTAPANAAWAEVFTYGADADANGSTVAVHKVGLWRGAGGTWQLPGVPVPGQSRIAVNNAVDLSGTGSPEGVVTAAPGSTWLQTDATTDVKGWIRWVKATGTGNTGWVAGPEADTGWRDVTAGLSSAGTTKYPNLKAAIRRFGKQVEMVVYTGASSVDGAAPTIIYAIPTGFKAKTLWTYRSPTGAMINSANGTPATAVGLYVGSGESATIGQSATAGVGSSVVGSMTWSTEQAWPSSLPGSAV